MGLNLPFVINLLKMGVYTVNIKTTSEIINIDNAPKCLCGGEFKFIQLWHKHKKTDEGVVATCKQCEKLFYSMNKQTIIEKINIIQAGGHYHF